MAILNEDDDLKDYKEAIEEYKKNPKTYTLDEMKEELGL